MARSDVRTNHKPTIDAIRVSDNRDQVLWSLEEPPLAMPALAQYRVFQLCAQHGATVVLDGQGSDEITAGYHYHQRLFLKQRLLRKQPFAFTRELTAIAKLEHRSAFGVMSDFFIAPRFRRTHYEWIAPSAARENADEFTSAARDYGRDGSLVNRQLYFDLRWGNVKI